MNFAAQCGGIGGVSNVEGNGEGMEVAAAIILTLCDSSENVWRFLKDKLSPFWVWIVAPASREVVKAWKRGETNMSHVDSCGGNVEQELNVRL